MEDLSENLNGRLRPGHRRGMMGVMKLRNSVQFLLILLSACGNNSSSTIETTSDTVMTLPVTSEPATGKTDGDTSSTYGPTSGSTSGVPTSSTTSADGGPVFLSFKANVSKITEGESVTFTALVTDPDGVDDIIGGSLLSGDEMIDHGPFVAAGQEGTYSISLSWAQIHQASPIAFENMELPLVLRARFFDQGGHSAIKDAGVALSCPGGSACGGSCTDLGLDGANCGACGHACASMGCDGGSCAPNWSGCFSQEDGFSSCAEICQSLGETCAEKKCGAYTTEYYGSLPGCLGEMNKVLGPDTCAKVQEWVKPAIKCCCTDSN